MIQYHKNGFGAYFVMMKVCKMIVCALGAVIAGSTFTSCNNNNSVTQNKDSATISLTGNSSYSKYVTDTGEYGDFIYEKGQDYIAISQYTGTDRDVIVPETIENLKVTTIKSRCFENSDNTDIINSVTLPSSINNVSSLAFYNSRYLETITCENNSYYVSENGILYTADMADLVAYPENKSDTEYTVPDSVTKINNNAFSFCNNLNKVTLSANLETIPDYTFAYNSTVVEVIVPANVKEIGFAAFYRCSALKKITLPESVSDINNNAVVFCNSLQSIECYGNNNVVKNYAESLGVQYTIFE